MMDHPLSLFLDQRKSHALIFLRRIYSGIFQNSYSVLMSRKRLFRLQNSWPCRQLGSLSKLLWQHARGGHKTTGLMNWIIALHVRFVSLYFSANTQYCVVWRTWMTTAKFSGCVFWRWTLSLHILPKLVLKPLFFFSPQATTIFGCCFKKRGNVKMAWCHYSGLFRVFCCSLEQNVWNTFHVFRNWKCVSIERMFGFIPFILTVNLIERTLKES